MASILNRLPLGALRTFEAASRRMSFYGAAQELGVTASAVSLQIRRLEERIGRPLFVRGHRGISLSETGEQLAIPIIEIFSKLDAVLADAVGAETSSLRITAMPSFAVKWLAPRLTRFSARHPDLSLRVEGSDALLTFSRDDADIGLRYGPGAWPGLFAERVFDVSAFPVCSPDYLERNREVLKQPAGLLRVSLLYDEVATRVDGLPSWPIWFKRAGVAGQPVRCSPVFESVHMALAAALAGQGVALGLSPLVGEDIQHARLVRLFEASVPSAYAFWLVCRAGREQERKIALFRRWVKEEVRGVVR